jgi:hypothetical protein
MKGQLTFLLMTPNEVTENCAVTHCGDALSGSTGISRDKQGERNR